VGQHTAESTIHVLSDVLARLGERETSPIVAHFWGLDSSLQHAIMDAFVHTVQGIGYAVVDERVDSLHAHLLDRHCVQCADRLAHAG
jgi:hypothetical protein